MYPHVPYIQKKLIWLQMESPLGNGNFAKTGEILSDRGESARKLSKLLKP